MDEFTSKMAELLKGKEEVDFSVIYNGRPRIQNVYITFSNGKKGVFSGPAVVDEKTSKGVSVSDISFSAPLDLPPDMDWVELNGKAQSIPVRTPRPDPMMKDF